MPARRTRTRGGWRTGSAAPSPRERSQRVDILTADGVSLAASFGEPEEGARGIVVLAHAMFARRSEFERPAGEGLVELLRRRGYRTLTFDFRGHGESATPARAGGDWSYDDLVRLDLPAVVSAARDRSEGGNVFVVGHSLGGHAALAAQGLGLVSADGVVLAASNVWLEELESSPLRWLEKRALMLLMRKATERRGYFPARALRQGSDDEARSYVEDIARPVETGRWASRDGRDDYRSALGRVEVPVFSIASDGDRLFCHPDAARRFLALCGGKVHFARVRAGDDGGRAPGHMELVTSPRARRVFGEALDWLERA